MEAMELLDVKPPPQVACTDGQQLQLGAIRRSFSHLEAQMAEIGGALDELIVVIDALAGHVRELRRLRALRLGGAPAADVVAPLREVECIFGRLSAQVRRVAAMRGSIVEMSRARWLGCGNGGGEAVDALAAGLQRIRIDLSQ